MPTLSSPSTTPRLAPAMQAAASEIYLFDAATLQVLDANLAACDNLRYALHELQAMTMRQLAPQWPADQPASLSEEIGAQASVPVLQRRRDASAYALTLRLSRVNHHGRALILAVGDDLATPQATAAALAQVQSRFNAICRIRRAWCTSSVWMRTAAPASPT